MKDNATVEKLQEKLTKHIDQAEQANQKANQLLNVITDLVDSLSFDNSITDRQYHRIKTELRQIDKSFT